MVVEDDPPVDAATVPPIIQDNTTGAMEQQHDHHQDEEEEDDFVPDSMKEFFAAADRELQANLEGILFQTNNIDEDHHHDEFMSPPLAAAGATLNNPAANLTHTTARNLAMEGASPDEDTPLSVSTDTSRGGVPLAKGTNLQADLEDVIGIDDPPEEGAKMNQAAARQPAAAVPVEEANSAAISSTPPQEATPSPATADASTSSVQKAKGVLLTVSPRAIEVQPHALSLVEEPMDVQESDGGNSTGRKSTSETKVTATAPNAKTPIVTPSRRPASENSKKESTGTPIMQELHPKALILDTPSPAAKKSTSRTSHDVVTPDRIGRAGGTTTADVVHATPSSQDHPRDTHLSAVHNPVGRTSPPRPLEIAFDKAFGGSSSTTPSQNMSLASPLSSRLLRGTASSRTKRSRPLREAPAGTTTNQANVKNKSSSPSKNRTGRKELTSPDKVPSRLLQGTTASKARISKREQLLAARRANKTRKKQPQQTKELAPVSSRLLQPTLVTQICKATSPIAKLKSAKHRAVVEQEVKVVEQQVQAHVQAEQAKDMARTQAIQDRLAKRQVLVADKRRKISAALQRAKGKREALAKAQEERRQQVQQELEIKQQKAEERLKLRQQEQQKVTQEKKRAQAQKKLVATPQPTTAQHPHQSRSKVFRPTIPVGPTFMKDVKSTPKQKETLIPLASSSTILMRNLRSPTSVTPSTTEPRRLTIPKGPTFSKEIAPSSAQAPRRKSPKGWESGLRGSSPSTLISPDRSTTKAFKLTIPKTPHFSDIKSRPRPKSTAEKEAETMEYYAAHPFRAQPVRMNLNHPTPTNNTGKRASIPAPRRLTTPSPFQLRTDQRSQSAQRSHRRQDEEEKVQLFKARPVPRFSRSTPLTGPHPPQHRHMTTPEPFQFHTESRKLPHKSPQVEEKPRPFKARPMPDFSKDVPESISWNTASKSAGEDVDSPPSVEDSSVPPFRARPMPKFDNPRIPVKQRHVPTSSPPTPQEEDKMQPFQARKLPDLASRPSIPVRDRNPTPLRSPTAEARRQAQSKENKRPNAVDTTSQPFKARPVPKVSPPSILVRDRDPSKLRSPKGRTPSSRLQSPTEVASTPRRQNPSGGGPTTPTLSSPKWMASPQQKKERKEEQQQQKDMFAARERLRKRLQGRQEQYGVKKFSSSRVKSKLAKVAPMSSPEPQTNNQVSSRLSQSPDASESAFVSASDGIHQTGQDDHLLLQPEQPPPELIMTMSPNDPTPRSGSGTGSSSFSDPMDKLAQAEVKRRDQERLAAAQLDQAMQMALDLQRAADDELSYHESSRDSTTDNHMTVSAGQ